MLLTQPWWPTWEGIAAIGQWIGGIGAILAVFYASQQVRVAIKQSEDSRDIALRQMEESRDLSIKQMEDNRKLVMEQIEEQRKIAMQQMEDNRDLVMKQLEEQRHLAEKQMDDNRELVLKQIEEQRNISEEEREPKVSIHTAIQEREIDGEKRRVLIATATNIGSMPIYLTESDSIDKGSISFRLWEALESYKNPKNIGLLNVTRRTKSDYNNNYYTCKTIDESLPKSLVPGDFATVEIDLTSGMEQKLYESYTDEYLNRFIKFDSENQFTKAEALWFRANVTPQLLLTIN
ncbi:hypothetical protein, partial [Bacillus rhizoplanae]|uniref:hypothetical protein n=1 Tax=Bacillus rhizoplanae TaxID=2880966 RepID=UPI003D21FEA8